MRRHNGSAKFHRDHIVPKAKGGGEAVNLRWVCWLCNSIRMDMDVAHDDAVGAAGAAFWRTIRAQVLRREETTGGKRRATWL